MTTVRDVVTLALKQARILAPGDAPSADEADDGLTAFQGMLDQWVNEGLFGKLTDEYLESSDTAKENRRYKLAAGVTLTIPETIQGDGGDYGAEGNTTEERQPFDLAIIESVTSAGVRSVKLRDRYQWVELTGLALGDDAPLADRGAIGLAANLAVFFTEMFGVGLVGPGTIQQARKFVSALSAKTATTQGDRVAEYF